MKKKSTAIIVALLVISLIATTALAGVLLHRQHADPVVFRGRIEQAPDEETALIFTANGVPFEGNADLTAGEVVFPLMSGEITSGANGWVDENGKVAVQAPTIEIATADGSPLSGIYCQIQIHGTPVAHQFRSVVEGMRFALGVAHCDADGPAYGCAVITNTVGVDGEPWSCSEWYSLGDLLEGQTIMVDLAAWSVSAAESDFYVELVFATGEYLEETMGTNTADTAFILTFVPIEPEAIIPVFKMTD